MAQGERVIFNITETVTDPQLLLGLEERGLVFMGGVYYIDLGKPIAAPIAALPNSDECLAFVNSNREEIIEYGSARLAEMAIDLARELNLSDPTFVAMGSEKSAGLSEETARKTGFRLITLPKVNDLAVAQRLKATGEWVEMVRYRAITGDRGAGITEELIPFRGNPNLIFIDDFESGGATRRAAHKLTRVKYGVVLAKEGANKHSPNIRAAVKNILPTWKRDQVTAQLRGGD